MMGENVEGKGKGMEAACLIVVVGEISFFFSDIMNDNA